MQHSGLSDRVKTLIDVSAQIASANVNGSTVNLSGYSGARYVINLGTMANGATFDARVVSSANSNMSGNTNLTNAAITQIANTGNTTMVVIEVWRPANTYIRLATMPATANCTFSSTVDLYGPTGNMPVSTQNASQTIRSVGQS